MNLIDRNNNMFPIAKVFLDTPQMNFSPSPLLVLLTYAVWNDLQRVLCEQQVSECHEAVQL